VPSRVLASFLSRFVENNFISELEIDYSAITRVQLHKCASLSDLNYKDTRNCPEKVMKIIH